MINGINETTSYVEKSFFMVSSFVITLLHVATNLLNNSLQNSCTFYIL